MRNKEIKNYSVIIYFSLFILVISSCEKKVDFYTANDFKNVPKTDVHLHINTLNPEIMNFTQQYKFRIVSPNVDTGSDIEEQLQTASKLKKIWPGQFTFLGTFSVDEYGSPAFQKNIISRIEYCLNEGASGIKIWKNIGMTLKDGSDKYVMVDDTNFDQVFKHIEDNNIPLMGHLGEPRNCWLPLSEMTDSSNYRYYKANPQYHMYLHPEAPSYDDQIEARDNLLKKFPELIFTGAHIGSLEWSVDEMAWRMDLFPKMNIDLSARVAHLQYQSIKDHTKVKDFILKYQDRIMYGTDITINESPSYDAVLKRLLDRWQSNWVYFATDSTQNIKDISQPVKGLKLPKEVIDKIYFTNATYLFE